MFPKVDFSGRQASWLLQVDLQQPISWSTSISNQFLLKKKKKKYRPLDYVANKI